jgi:transcriptional regulatory protein RtcR
VTASRQINTSDQLYPCTKGAIHRCQHRLRRHWSGAAEPDDGLATWLSREQVEALDPFDRVQLAHVVGTCRKSRSLSEAGRSLFAVSRSHRASSNDADRLRKYLARFDLSWQQLQE